MASRLASLPDPPGCWFIFVTYEKVSGNKKIKINNKTGKVTVKKGIKKGTYKVKVKVTVAGNDNFEATEETVTFKVKIKK